MKYFKILLVGILLIGQTMFSQKVKISGQSLASEHRAAVGYASISFINLQDKFKSDAVLTDDNGKYSIDLIPGEYRVEIDAIDFEKFSKKILITKPETLEAFILINDNKTTSTKEIKEVVITAQSKQLYKIDLDKKVYNVDSDITTKGGNLSDVLSNLPSVNIDPSGAVSMRGNSNVRFLINGKPSSMMGITDDASVLSTIPASSIDRIEIITNPSSKYDAAGTAGILNIILKKNSGVGFNGSVEGNLGYFPRSGLNANLSWKLKDFSWYINGGGNYRENRMISNTLTRFINNEITTSTIDQLGKTISKNDNYTANFGFNYEINPSISINSNFVINYTKSNSDGNNAYKTFNADGILINNYERIALGDNLSKTLQWDAGLEKKFDDKGHQLNFSTSLQKSENNSTNKITDYVQNPAILQNLINNNNENTFLAKLDYELPIGEKSKLEAGARYDDRLNSTLNEFSNQENGQYIINANLSNEIDYSERISAVYAQFKSKINKLGYQFGLRNEYTQVNIDFRSASNSNTTKNYNGLFPSLFLSYELGDKSQLQLNYSRRLNRPRSFFLIPSIRVQDNINRFQGNADLNPVYINSFEFGYNLTKGKFSINPTLYLQLSKDNFNFFPSVSQDENGQNITTNSVYNIGDESRYGVDTNASLNLYSWWRIFGNVNVFGYQNSGNFRNINFENKGYATEAKLSNAFKLSKNTNLQIQSNYESGMKSLSNNRKAIYSFSMGINANIWNNQGTIGFNIQDILNSRKRQVEQSYTNVNKEIVMQFQPRTFILSLTYKFKNKDFGESKSIKKEKSKEIQIRGGDEGM